VKDLVSRGLTVAVADLKPAKVADLAELVDVRDLTSLIRFADRIRDELGPIDHLVASAGYYSVAAAGSPDHAEWASMLDVHVMGVAHACYVTLPDMVRRRQGSICAVGSELGLTGDPEAPHYAAAKGAVHSLMRSLAAEVAGYGVRVNCVAPGPTDTSLLQADPRGSHYATTVPLGRILSADEVASAICFALLEESNIVGQVISPNGGAVV
jgi:2-hydroxycyclohexanecarboxyl-CoA dehydrogenase